MTSPFSYHRIFGIASCSLLLATSLAGSAEPQQQQQDAAESKDDSSESLDVQLAKTRLQLAKLELDRALATNKQVPIYTAVTLELLRRDVDICEARLDALSRPGEASLHAAHLRELEHNLKIAEIKWKGAVQLRERLLIDTSQVESLRLRAQVARLALERARDPSHVTTPMDHIHWQLQQLRQEMLELTLRVDELSNKN